MIYIVVLCINLRFVDFFWVNITIFSIIYLNNTEWIRWRILVIAAQEFISYKKYTFHFRGHALFQYKRNRNIQAFYKGCFLISVQNIQYRRPCISWYIDFIQEKDCNLSLTKGRDSKLCRQRTSSPPDKLNAYS